MKSRALVLVAFLAIMTGCGVSTSMSYYDQKPQILRTEYDGSYVIRSSGKDRNAKLAMEEAQKTAIYDVIFNGVASGSSTVTSLKPLLMEINAKEKYQDYFNAFFSENGEYRKYISTEDKRTASTNFRRNWQQVQCITTVTVNIPELKAKLKEDKIIK